MIGTPRSRTARVLWMLEELGQPYTTEPAAPHSPAVIAVNPTGKIPVLIVDGAALTDSTAILQFLADRHGALSHAPGTADRARQDALTQVVLEGFDAVLWMAAQHARLLPEHLRHPDIRPTLEWQFARAEADLVRRMGDGPFLMGAEITVPDIVCAHCGMWARLSRFPISVPAFADYLDRMRARPAFRRAMGR